jgi:hypothetical protein
VPWPDHESDLCSAKVLDARGQCAVSALVRMTRQRRVVTDAVVWQATPVDPYAANRRMGGSASHNRRDSRCRGMRHLRFIRRTPSTSRGRRGYAS